MRSQLFGFHIQTHYLSEAILSCSLQQAQDITVQHLHKLEALSTRLNGQQTGIVTGEAYTLGIEVMLNEWDDELEELVREVIRDQVFMDALTRMRALRLSLSWLWTNFRETAAMAQFMLATTIDEETHLSLTVGWNSGASSEDVALADQFTQLYFVHLEHLGVPFRWLTFRPNEMPTTQKRKYGPRADTLEKMQKLAMLRADYLRNGEVTVTRTHACELVGITPSVVKKYRPELHERWYDPDYMPEI